MDCSLPGSSVHEIFQARVLEWVAISFSRGSSQPRDPTWISHTVGRRFTVWATRKEGLLIYLKEAARVWAVLETWSAHEMGSRTPRWQWERRMGYLKPHTHDKIHYKKKKKDSLGGLEEWQNSLQKKKLTPILRLLSGLITSPQVGEAGISCFQMMTLLLRETEIHQGHAG